MALRVAQELRFGDGELHRILRILVGDALQESARFVELALLRDGVGGAHARRQHVIAALMLSYHSIARGQSFCSSAI